jgi:hypothetical protein
MGGDERRAGDAAHERHDGRTSNALPQDERGRGHTEERLCRNQEPRTQGAGPAQSHVEQEEDRAGLDQAEQEVRAGAHRCAWAAAEREQEKQRR